MNIKILTNTGYQSFDGLKKVQEKGLCIYLKNTQINCTKSHRIKCGRTLKGSIFRQAKNLKINDKIFGEHILKIEEDSTNNYYDPINVHGDHTYTVQGITHHNCGYTVTDEAAYIKGRDNGMTKFSAYLDSMLPSQSSLAVKKNIFISTANGMNEFYTLYSGAQKEGFEEVQEILDAESIIYSESIENHYTSDSIEKPKEIISIEPVESISEKIQKYNIKYKKRKIGANNSIAFTTDWKKVPRWNQDGTRKTPEQFRNEIIASKGEIFFNQAYGNLFYGSSYTLLPVTSLKAVQTPEPIEIIDQKLKIYKKFIKGHQYVCTVDPAKDGVDGFVVNFTDITSFRLEQVATANLDIDYLLMPELLDDWCKLYGKPYLIIENNEGAGQSVADQMKITYEYDNLHYDINKNIKNNVKAKKKYPGTRTTKTSRNQILKTFKTFFNNGNLIINDEETIKQLYTFILIDGKYQADNGEHDDCVMSLALVFILFTNAKNITDMSEVTKQLKQDLDAIDPVNIKDLITVGNFDCEYTEEKSNTYTDVNGISYTGFDENQFDVTEYDVAEFG